MKFRIVLIVYLWKFYSEKFVICKGVKYYSYLMVYERKLKINDEILYNLSWYKIDFFFLEKSRLIGEIMGN